MNYDKAYSEGKKNKNHNQIISRHLHFFCYHCRMKTDNRMPTIFDKLYDFDGEDKYFRKVFEEMAEFSACLSHFIDGKANETDVALEHADVLLQLEKVMNFMTNEMGFIDYREMVLTQLAIKTGNLASIPNVKKH